MRAPASGSNFDMKYFDEMCRAMEFLGRDERTIFLGQAVACPGTAMSNTLKNVSRDKLLELPVTEEMQMGMTTGLALGGHVPVSFFPRMPQIFDEPSTANPVHHRGQWQIRLHRYARNVEPAGAHLRKRPPSASGLLQVSNQISACRRRQTGPILT